MNDPQPDSALPRVEVVRGDADADDLAALTAVLPAAYAEEVTAATAGEPATPDAWTQSRRMRRRPVPGRAWGRFSG